MTLNQDIFAVKLYEMEKQYGRLQSRLRICGRENRKKLQAELEHAKEEYEENSLLLKQSIQGSRSPAVAELAQVQWGLPVRGVRHGFRHASHAVRADCGPHRHGPATERGRKEGGTNPMKETKKWAAALLAGAAAVGAAAAGLAFWKRKKHNALPSGEAEEPQALPLEEQGEEAPDGEAPGEAPEETEPAVEPAADTETNEAEEASHDE